MVTLKYCSVIFSHYDVTLESDSVLLYGNVRLQYIVIEMLYLDMTI